MKSALNNTNHISDSETYMHILPFFIKSHFLCYLVGEVIRGLLFVDGEAQREHHDVRQRGNDAQHHGVPQLEGQHGVHGEDDEEEERHLETQRVNYLIMFIHSRTSITFICLQLIYINIHYIIFYLYLLVLSYLFIVLHCWRSL